MNRYLNHLKKDHSEIEKQNNAISRMKEEFSKACTKISKPLENRITDGKINAYKKRKL